jgi:DNA-binding XRE family transcriptional regulator
MPRKPTQKNPIRDLRAIINKSQKAFAQIIGINPGTLKRIENNDLKLSRKIAMRIWAETGADSDDLLRGELRVSLRKRFEGEYSDKFYASWKERHLRADEETVKERTTALAWWVEVLLRASARKRRFWQVLGTLNETVDECCKNFGLAPLVDTILRDIEPRVRWNPASHTPRKLAEIEADRKREEQQHDELMTRVRFHWDELPPRKSKTLATKRQLADWQRRGTSAGKPKLTAAEELKRLKAEARDDERKKPSSPRLRRKA